ncbi:MAG: DUF2442 domain-containing protein [Clostridia bacterium]|nr:DUF2442 domain-containing protein [Clostridia bacterium]
MKMIMPNIVEARALDDRHIYLKYEDGKIKVYDMKPLIDNNNFYAKLKDRNYFNQVKPCSDTIEWPNGEDVCPENLYYDSKDI